MAASSSGGGNVHTDIDVDNAMDVEGSGSPAIPTAATCVELTFDEFLRQRGEEVVQGRSPSTSTSASTSTSWGVVGGGNVEVDESPLKPSINRNKESLKIKLQMRRPMNQLVEQGIIPSPNTPPAYVCQRVKLERARMGDLLKAKIQSRPSRQELVRQHILEETDPRVAPLLAEKQRMLKRARLADSLNDHLIHRPGPLELVKKNILHAPDESIEKAIKEGIVPFKATCEGATPGPPLPTKYICQEDDSSSDVSSPSVNLDSVSAEENNADTPPPPPVSAADVTVPEPVVEVQNKAPTSVPTTIPTISPFVQPPPPPPPPPPYPFAISEISPTTTTQQIFAVPFFENVSQSIIPQPVFQQQSIVQQPPAPSSSSSFKSRSKKISQKSKSQSKPKTIKFHEYRGPPSAQKSSSSNTTETKRPPESSSSTESSYELLLQQQQLFLQWQLEWQHRFPKILLPAVSKMTPEEKKAFCSTLQQQQQSSTTSTFPATAVVSHHSLQVDNSLPMQIISNPSNSVLILSSSSVSSAEPSSGVNTLTHHVPQVTPTAPLQQKTSVSKLEEPSKTPPPKLNDWKVNELKVELKKRNLPVSGSKSQLVERLQGSFLKDNKDSTQLKPVAVGVDHQGKKIETKENGPTVVTCNVTSAVSQPQELKFYITTNNNSTATLLDSGAIEFLQKSGILLKGDGKDLAVTTTVDGIPLTIQPPSSRSVLQQKIQQKMQQQQLQAKEQLLNLNVKREPAAAAVVVNNNNELKWILPTSSLIKTEELENPESTSSNANASSAGQQNQSEDPWVLKITETTTPSSASFENCLADLLSSEATSQPTTATTSHALTQEQQDHVKSQMVDDVLEILIRNGELPASAAQDVTTTNSHPQQSTSLIPPAPPLPPTTFAVTLPTEISFRRLTQPNDYPQINQKPVPERKNSLLGITSLTKEAQDILKISQDLVTCNKSQEEEPHTSHHQIKKEPLEEFMELDTHSSPLPEMKAHKLNGDSSSLVIDELLTDMVEFPMDLDAQYSDWLESFSSSDNTFNNFNNQVDSRTMIHSAEDSSHHHNRGDPLLSSTKSGGTTADRLTILDNCGFPIEQGHNVLMDVDQHAPSGAETELMKIRKGGSVGDNVNVNNHNELWDFSF